MSTLSSIRPEAKEVVEVLSKKYRLGVMANQPTKTADKFKVAGIDGYFSQLGMSHDYGYHKPDPRLYAEILAETKAVAERSVMIDDNYERGLRTAKDLGFKIVWYLETGSRFWIPDAKADWIIGNLRDLLSIF